MPQPGCRGPASILGSPPTAAESPRSPPRPDCRSRPRTRTPSCDRHTRTVGRWESNQLFKRPLVGRERYGRVQLIQHSLHLLVDLVGERAARLLVLGSASLALRHAQVFGVAAPGRLAARLSLAAAQGGGGRGHLRGGGFKISLLQSVGSIYWNVWMRDSSEATMSGEGCVILNISHLELTEPLLHHSYNRTASIHSFGVSEASHRGRTWNI